MLKEIREKLSDAMPYIVFCSALGAYVGGKAFGFLVLR